MFSLSKRSVRWLGIGPLLRASKFSTARPALESAGGADDADKAPRSGMVAAAFASLKSEAKVANVGPVYPTYMDRLISKADTVDKLLSVADKNVSRQNALKVVSVLAQWSATKKVQLSDFETDPRFVRVCRALSRGSAAAAAAVRSSVLRDNDLSTVLSVTGDDEAARLVEGITVPQMVRVLGVLAQRRRRSPPLLRSLAHSLGGAPDPLDAKQCADVLYGLAVLNYPDPALLQRVCGDAANALATLDGRSAVVGSMLTSLGLLRYRDDVLLDGLARWLAEQCAAARPQDLHALLLTLATVGHTPPPGPLPALAQTDLARPLAWLDHVWALCVLGRATTHHLRSVLCPEFAGRLEAAAVPPRAKLLAVHAVAQLLVPDYDGPLLPAMRALPLARSRHKQALVDAVLDSLASLFPSAAHLRTNVDTGMGFLLDAECAIDSKCTPLPVMPAQAPPPDRLRVAVVAYDYHDMSRGLVAPLGAHTLARQLLEARGFRLLAVPHTHFSPRDNVVQRVKYLETQLKAIAAGHR